MNTLPEHRRIQHGRTFDRAYHPCDMDLLEEPFPRRMRMRMPWRATLGVFAAAVLLTLVAFS